MLKYFFIGNKTIYILQKMNILNDKNCSWINDLDSRVKIQELNQDENCEWLVVELHTGLSAARKLGQLLRNQKIIVVDAQLAGEGASGRNSGYLVDTTLNDGFTSNKELTIIKTEIYKLGIDVIKKFIKEYQVDCDLNECEKYFASSKIEDKKFKNFSNILCKLGFDHRLMDNEELSKRLELVFINSNSY